MKIVRTVLFCVIFPVIILKYFWRTSLTDAQHRNEYWIDGEKNFPKGSLTMASEKNYTSGLVDVKMIVNGHLFASIVTSEDDGRLGNQICAYASVLYFQIVHGMHAILADWQINMLAVVFQKEKFQINASRIVLPPQFSLNWEVVGTMAPQGAFFPNEDFLENIEEYKYNKFLDIGRWPNYLFLYKEILDDIREHLLFKQDIQTVADQWLADIKMENSDKEILFIGVHCRRTDYAHQLMIRSAATMVDNRFFEKAFDIYRSRYNNGKTQVVFLVVSDDTPWIKETLSNHEDVRFGFDFSQGKVADADMPGYDLCLMAACNHSIHDYGTFGTWGSLLAGGDVITATGTSQEVDTEEDQIYKKAAMVGWVYLDMREPDNIQEVTYQP